MESFRGEPMKNLWLNFVGAAFIGALVILGITMASVFSLLAIIGAPVLLMIYVLIRFGSK